MSLLPVSPRIEALALSDVELVSHLNQRLLARIHLLQVSAEELSELNIEVSELIDGDTAGRRTVLSHEIVTEGSNHYLDIRSKEAVREPILSFSVELNWSSGHLIRNYALIIDPQ